MSEHLAKLIEALAVAWLSDSDLGREIHATMTTDEAIDAVFNLLNQGFLKLAIDRSRQPVGFTFSPNPKPPMQPIMRPNTKGNATNADG
jgi:hypothetical protein